MYFLLFQVTSVWPKSRNQQAVMNRPPPKRHKLDGYFHWPFLFPNQTVSLQYCVIDIFLDDPKLHLAPNAALLCMRIIQSTILLRCPKWGSTGSSGEWKSTAKDKSPKKLGIGCWKLSLKNKRWWWWDSHVHSCSSFFAFKKHHSGPIFDQGRSNPCCNVGSATYLVLGCLEGGP